MAPAWVALSLERVQGHDIRGLKFQRSGLADHSSTPPSTKSAIILLNLRRVLIMSCDWERDAIEDAFRLLPSIILCGMQHQQTRNATQSVNQTQSLAAVQTLLRAGLGAITFLRSSIVLFRDS